MARALVLRALPLKKRNKEIVLLLILAFKNHYLNLDDTKKLK